MAALLDQMENPAPSGVTETIRALAQGDTQGHSHTASVYKSKMPDLMKGAGFRGPGGNAPLTDQADIMARAAQATVDLRAETQLGFRSKSSVVKSMSPVFMAKFGALATALSQPSLREELAAFFGAVASPDLVRSFTAGNLGINTVSGLTPFNLLAP